LKSGKFNNVKIAEPSLKEQLLIPNTEIEMCIKQWQELWTECVRPERDYLE